MALKSLLPDPGILATGMVVVALAVGLWGGISLARGTFVRPLEALLFALVFAVVYFGSLALLNSDSDTEAENRSE